MREVNVFEAAVPDPAGTVGISGRSTAARGQRGAPSSSMSRAPSGPTARVRTASGWVRATLAWRCSYRRWTRTATADRPCASTAGSLAAPARARVSFSRAAGVSSSGRAGGAARSPASRSARWATMSSMAGRCRAGCWCTWRPTAARPPTCSTATSSTTAVLAGRATCRERSGVRRYGIFGPGQPRLDILERDVFSRRLQDLKCHFQYPAHAVPPPFGAEFMFAARLPEF